MGLAPPDGRLNGAKKERQLNYLSTMRHSAFDFIVEFSSWSLIASSVIAGPVQCKSLSPSHLHHHKGCLRPVPDPARLIDEVFN